MPSHLMPNYKRFDLAFTHGDGAWLTGTDGRHYLDFGAGIAVSSLGHNHPRLSAALAEQAHKLLHVSNLYHIPEAETLADLLVARSFADSVFFCNSGAEANEGLVKLMRRAQYKNGHPERSTILCFRGAFHGRTLAMISATGNPAYQEGFGPVVPGFIHAEFNDTASVRAALTPDIAGILVEPVQGESGVKPANLSFLQELRQICDENGLYLGIDEVQTGIGRTGKLFAYEHAGITPDIVSLAKGIGGGFPLGAVLARRELAQYLTPGTHGTTYGGNPMACIAGRIVLEEINNEALARIAGVSCHFHQKLTQLVTQYPHIFKEIRGLGLMCGLICVPPVGDVLASAHKEGLLAVGAGENVLRLVPPLIVTEELCDQACAILDRVAQSFS